MKDKLQKAKTYIDEHLTDNLTLDSLASIAAYSTYHFAREFKNEFDMSVMEYVRRERLNAAKLEIGDGVKIVSAALKYGFETHAGFTKAFVAEFGCAPSVYAAQSLKKRFKMDNAVKILSGITDLSYGDPSEVCYIGALMRLLEYRDDPVPQDELFALSGTGLAYIWSENIDCNDVGIIHDIPMRTMKALGYESEYYSEDVKYDDAVPGAIPTGTWPLEPGTYDPGLDGMGIPDGTKIFGLFDSNYNKIAPPESVEGFDPVSSVEELIIGTWCVLNSSTDFNYILLGCEIKQDGDENSRMYPKEFYIEKIRRSIDAGRPVIGFGLITGMSACLITGYYDGGDGLFVNSFQKQGSYISDWYERIRAILLVGDKTGERLTGVEAYKYLADWALHFRVARSRPITVNGQTVLVGETAFDALERHNDRETVLKELARVRHYRNQLFAYLKRLDLDYPGFVNPAVFKEHEYYLQMLDTVPEVRQYSDFDNEIQWALFMPDLVQKQLGETGITLDSFEYKKMPAFRFIGVETDDEEERNKIRRTLDSMPEYTSEFGYDIQFVHHYGLGVDVEDGHIVFGRFMKADTPVPDGYLYFDFVPEWTGEAGVPYLSQFAFAIYTGDSEALRKTKSFDVDVMYDVTRNIILGENVSIPYPEKYWTAEIMMNEPSRGGYLFSVDLNP